MSSNCPSLFFAHGFAPDIYQLLRLTDSFCVMEWHAAAI